jgi:uncharacterized protein YciI
MPALPLERNHTPDFLYMVRPPRPTFPADGTPEELEAVGEHFQYLKQMLEAGTLYLAGRREDAEFGIAVFKADDLAAAQEIAANDPAIVRGVFTVEVWPFQVALATGQ